MQPARQDQVGGDDSPLTLETRTGAPVTEALIMTRATMVVGDTRNPNDTATRRRRPARPLAAALVLVAVIPLAAGAATGVPDHATAREYGSGWTCDPGFREDAGGCSTIVVPEHAYADGSTYGSGWQCRWGYKRVSAGCEAIQEPAHAFLFGSRGDAWKCERGYRRQNGACEAIVLPAHAYLTHRTDLYDVTGWRCERGYRVVDGGCAEIALPENAFLDDGRDGKGWDCERGYVANGDRCTAVRVPANAHLDFSGSGWECDLPYRQRSAGCELP